MSTSDDIADDIVVAVAGYDVLSIISQNSYPTEVYTSMLDYISADKLYHSTHI